MFLLDTNACIRILNGTCDRLVARLKEHEPGEVRLCSVVKAELLYGARRSSRTADNLRLLGRFFEPVVCLPFDDLSAELYGLIRAELERLGTPIGPRSDDRRHCRRPRPHAGDPQHGGVFSRRRAAIRGLGVAERLGICTNVTRNEG